MDESALWGAAALGAAAGVAFGLAHWRDRRRIAALRHEVQRLEKGRQDQLRMSAQTRKQIEDLQKVVAEYRRRLSAQEAARRARVAQAPVVVESVEAEDCAPAVRTGGWADTQPM